jgi:hypothetical protein
MSCTHVPFSGSLTSLNLTFIYTDRLNLGDEAREKSLSEADAAIQAAIAGW